MSVTKIDDSALVEQKRYHISQPDVPMLAADDMKAFFDYVPREVIIPKVNEVIDEVNGILSYTGEGGYSKSEVDGMIDGVTSFVPASVGLKCDRLYFNASAAELDEAGYSEYGTDHTVMGFVHSDGTADTLYLRSNYDGTYSLHPEKWIFTTVVSGAGPHLCDMSGLSDSFTVTSLTELGKYLSLKSVYDPGLRHITEHQLADSVTEYGESNGIYYRKWKSGRSECWGFIELDYESSQSVVYVDGAVSFPDGLFVNIPAATVTPFGTESEHPTLFIADISGSGIDLYVKDTPTGAHKSLRFNVQCMGAWRV